MYVDESGDSGHSTAITSYYTLSGLLIFSEHWNDIFKNVKKFRKNFKKKYGLTLKGEIHATDIWRNVGDFKGLNLTYANRLHIFQDISYFIRKSLEATIINISINKSSVGEEKNINRLAWNLLIQRFENFILENNRLGIIVADVGNIKLIRGLLRKMRVYNPIPSRYKGYRNKPIINIIEDPFFRRSRYSYFIQLTDIIAYLVRLRHDATMKQKQYKLHKLFKRMKPRFNLQASLKDNYGIVYYP